MTVDLILGDCLDVMRGMADGSVDAVITDPPYGVNLDYGRTFDDSADYWTMVVPPVVYWADERGTICVIFGASPTQARDLAAFHRTPDHTLIWAPSFSLSKSQAHGMFYRWHPIYCWNLPHKHDGPKMDVLRTPCDGHNWWFHPGTKPLALMLELIGFAPMGGTVFDPFLGSGTTLVAAAMTGRQGLGVEISPTYYAIAERRIREAQAQPSLWHEPESRPEQVALL